MQHVFEKRLPIYETDISFNDFSIYINIMLQQEAKFHHNYTFYMNF